MPLSLVYAVAVAALGIGVCGSVFYLLTLLVAAASPARREATTATTATTGNTETRFAVIVPAHDEELVLAATLRSLNAQNYPKDRREIVVVADNCSDTTAAIAREHGATVLERTDAAHRGKGYALDWAMTHLLQRPEPSDAFAIIDADTEVEPDFLRIMSAALDTGTGALQGRYGVLNSGDGWRTALMAGAFDLVNHVQPMGRDRLGASAGLKGNGMVFSRALLTTARWRGDSITEDIDFGLDLLERHEVRVRYVPGAVVRAQMPTGGSPAETQRARWENGRADLMRRRAVPLLLGAVRHGSPARFDAALSLLVPPLAEMTGMLLLWGVMIALGHLAKLLSGPFWTIGWSAAALGLTIYLLAGLKVADAPPQAYRALFQAPFYLVWKIVLRFTRRKNADWVRTDRMAISVPFSAAAAADESTNEDRTP